MRWLALSILLLATTSHAQPLRDRVRLGAFVNGLPYEDSGAFRALERKLGTKLEVLAGFVDWEYVLGNQRDLALSDQGKRTLLYSWEPHCVGERCVSFASVARGEHDAYLLRVAESMKRFPHDLYVRPWGELNAEWSAWQPDSGRPRAGTRDEFLAAWRHLHTFFRERGVTNLKFVFNPDASDFDTNTRVPSIWPGAEYVDVLGIDGYNWGDGPHEQWRTFEDIFARMYEVVTALHPSAPVWICELGSKEPRVDDGSPARPAPVDPRHDKGRWLTDMMQSERFPRLTTLVSFNVRKERDFRLESSASSLQAMRKQLRLRTGSRSAR
ncbi:MAG: glycosyl hydrolase [Polyangiales bacterium]